MSTPPEPAVPKPERASRFPFQFGALMFVLPAAALVLGLVLGGGPVLAVVFALIVLAVVFLGVGGVMRRKGFEKKPGRNPVRTPSA